MPDKHIFCIAIDGLDLLYSQETILLTNKDHVRRISAILRLEHNDELILFNRTCKALTIIRQLHQKKIILQVAEWALIKPLSPSITLVLPLLRKTAFEEALYNATEHGVNHFIFYSSTKSQKKIEHCNTQRIENIIIAAAEQSRNYVYPTIEGPYTFEQSFLDMILKRYEYCIFMDPSGVSITENLSTLKHNSYAILVGPEGDLDVKEKVILLNNNIMSMKLTPTILRASQAAGTSVGLLRALLE